MEIIELKAKHAKWSKISTIGMIGFAISGFVFVACSIAIIIMMQSNNSVFHELSKTIMYVSAIFIPISMAIGCFASDKECDYYSQIAHKEYWEFKNKINQK